MSMISWCDTKVDMKILSLEDRHTLRKYYPGEGDSLSDVELSSIWDDYKSNKITNESVLSLLNRYQVGEKNNTLREETIAHHFTHQFDINETTARYAGYSFILARAFRRYKYLALTSDFGTALSPIVSKTIVNGAYAVTIGYCLADVGWEAYKLKKRNYVTEKGEPMSVAQCVVERATFQGIASIAVPSVLIHSSMDMAKKYTTKIGRFTKWGPSIVGLSVLSLLPLYLDAPIERALEWTFENYSPWALYKKSHRD